MTHTGIMNTTNEKLIQPIYNERELVQKNTQVNCTNTDSKENMKKQVRTKKGCIKVKQKPAKRCHQGQLQRKIKEK